jgi:hypothetical protein
MVHTKSRYPAGSLLVDRGGRVFIHDGKEYINGYGCIMGEDSDGHIKKVTGTDLWNRWYVEREANDKEIERFLEKLKNEVVWIWRR